MSTVPRRGHPPRLIICAWCGRRARVRASNALYHPRCKVLAAQWRQAEKERKIARERLVGAPVTTATIHGAGPGS